MSSERENVPIESKLRPPLSEAAVARIWRGVRDARMARMSSRSSNRTRTFGYALVIAAFASMVWTTDTRRQALPGALSAENHTLITGESLVPSPTPIVFDEGSRMVLTASTELEVLSNDGHRFVTLLRRGSCGFSVTPGGPRRWSIETDLATVEVVGTEFTVNRHDEGLAVHVTRGVVLVRGEHVPGRVQRLGAGQALEVRDTRALEQTETPLRTTAPAANQAPASATATSETTRSESVASIPRRAFDFDTEMEQADRARAEGRFDDAARILSAALREGGDDSQAAIAGFSLGRLQLDILNRPNDAATTFCAVVRRGSPRALVEDAQARCVEALARAGRRDEAIRQARVYETRWPEGRRLAEVRAFVAQ